MDWAFYLGDYYSMIYMNVNKTLCISKESTSLNIHTATSTNTGLSHISHGHASDNMWYMKLGWCLDKEWPCSRTVWPDTGSFTWCFARRRGTYYTRTTSCLVLHCSRVTIYFEGPSNFFKQIANKFSSQGIALQYLVCRKMASYIYNKLVMLLSKAKTIIIIKLNVFRIRW